MSLGVGEMAELDVGLGTPSGPEEPRPAEALCLRESGLNVSHPDVEGHVAGVVRGRS